MSLKYNFTDEIVWMTDNRYRCRKHEMPQAIYDKPRSYLFKNYCICRNITFLKKFVVCRKIYSNGDMYISPKMK